MIPNIKTSNGTHKFLYKVQKYMFEKKVTNFQLLILQNARNLISAQLNEKYWQIQELHPQEIKMIQKLISVDWDSSLFRH